MEKPLMKCGHTANAKDGEGNPVCAICAVLVPGWNEVDENPPSLAGRLARCTYYGSHNPNHGHGPIYGGCECKGYCHCETASAPELPFFRPEPEADFDRFYCGCKGWD